MFNGESTSFRFGFGGDASAATVSTPPPVTREARPDVLAAKEIDASAVVITDDTWSGAYYDVEGVEVVRGEYGFTAATLEGCPEESDLVSKVYEGGLKVWECADDLASYIARERLSNVRMGDDIHVCELGAGHGIPGLVAMRVLGGRCRAFTTCDYNEDVVCEVTVPNTQATIELMQECGEIPPTDVKFLTGDWGGYAQFVREKSVDVILSSDSLYDVDAYEGLCSFIAHALRDDGACYVAAKSYYFGVGGSTHAFSKYCERFSLRAKNVTTFSDGQSNVREILVVQRVDVNELAASYARP